MMTTTKKILVFFLRWIALQLRSAFLRDQRFEDTHVTFSPQKYRKRSTSPLAGEERQRRPASAVLARRRLLFLGDNHHRVQPLAQTAVAGAVPIATGNSGRADDRRGQPAIASLCAVQLFRFLRQSSRHHPYRCQRRISCTWRARRRADHHRYRTV